MNACPAVPIGTPGIQRQKIITEFVWIDDVLVVDGPMTIITMGVESLRGVGALFIPRAQFKAITWPGTKGFELHWRLEDSREEDEQRRSFAAKIPPNTVCYNPSISTQHCKVMMNGVDLRSGYFKYGEAGETPIMHGPFHATSIFLYIDREPPYFGRLRRIVRSGELRIRCEGEKNGNPSG